VRQAAAAAAEERHRQKAAAAAAAAVAKAKAAAAAAAAKGKGKKRKGAQKGKTPGGNPGILCLYTIFPSITAEWHMRRMSRTAAQVSRNFVLLKTKSISISYSFRL
jgi:hypothetical protein